MVGSAGADEFYNLVVVGPGPSMSGKVRWKAFIKHLCTWWAITLILAVVVFAIVSPDGCPNVGRCSAVHAETSIIYNACAASALGAVLVHELVCLCLTYKSARRAMHIIHNLRDTLIPPALLCATLSVLFIQNVLFAGPTPWYANAMRLGDDNNMDGEPVYTVFYLEWMINLPILLILAGRYALRRPMTEITRPLVVTNVYIILSWAVYFIPSHAGRIVTVVVSFAMYGWCSFDMMRWVFRFRKEHPEAPLTGRPFLTITLIVIFGVYGVVYLCRLCGVLSAVGERMCYTALDSSTKLMVSMAFAGLRSSHYHNMLLDMVVNTNTAFQRSIKKPEPAEQIGRAMS